jgi:hypothetical protein
MALPPVVAFACCFPAESRSLPLNLELSQVKILGQLHNGVGFSFHIGDFSGEGHVEIGTVDYIRDLPLDRPLVDAPIQAVYYRWNGSQFAETGRGPVHDPRHESEPPPSIRRFMGKSWNVEDVEVVPEDNFPEGD